VIAPEQSAAYLDALQARQLRGEEGDWALFLAGQLEASLRNYLDHLRRDPAAAQRKT
jgi:hypothetical protein